WGYLARNPMEYVERPPQRPVRPAVVLDEVQAVALLRAARAERLGAVFALALTTTMRIGEILALRWEDLDLERRRVRVTRTLSRLGGRWLETEGKTAASRRTIDLAPWVVAWLRAHQARQAAERAQAATWVRPDLVFTSQYHPGAPVNSGVLRLYVLPRILRRAGLDVRMCLHDLRKTAISLYLRAGEDLKVVQRLAGHATPAMTLHVYRNLVGDEAREAVDRFAPRLDPDGTPRGADREPPNNLPVRSRRGAQLA
ncbi:MAG TPA: site-specific integrase, partial [Chloroflexota bacterium]|nr:site-specific integrase [Chloroflexota bacterium]